MKIDKYLTFASLLLIGTAAFAQHDTTTKTLHAERPERKHKFGIVLGAGTSRFNVTNADWKQGAVNYHDSINSLTSASVFKFDLGLLYQIKLHPYVSFRPCLSLSFEGGRISYHKTTGVETLDALTLSETLSLPFVLKYPGNSFEPYITAGPGFSFMIAQDDDVRKLLPLKRFDILGELGIGVTLKMPKLKLAIAPEMKYTSGLLNVKGRSNQLYSNTIDQLKRQAFTFSLYLLDI
jgi:hypothetical protein